MSVTSVAKDLDALSLTLVAEFAVPLARVWDLWSDPRKLERWWGPPTYPATMVEYDLTPGGRVNYYMTSPEGERFGGWWEFTSVEPPQALEFIDGFADAHGEPSVDMPVTTVSMRLTEAAGTTRMELRSSFESREQMEQLMTMGMEEGLGLAVGQMDALLAD